MLKQALASEFLVLWPSIATVVFVGFSILVILWMLRPGATSQYKLISQSLFDASEEKSDDR